MAVLDLIIKGAKPVYRSPKSLEFRRRSVGCFSRRSEPDWRCRYLDHNGRASNAEKQPTGRGPEGCVENGSACFVARQSRIDRDMLLPTPVRLGPPRRRLILNATKLKGFRRRYTGPLISGTHL